MALFNKLDKPIFLKEESEAKYYISKLQELHSRAPEGLKGRIEKELKIATLGELGENNIAFELKNSGIPMYILHDICLETNELSAQIDYIVVTRKVIFIIECKNLIGNIEINSQGNFIRTYNFNGKFIKEGIYSPITQNERHLEVLKRIKKESKSNFISKMLFDKYFNDNYKSLVVLANPKTVLNSRYAKKEIKDKVIKADQLINYIKEVNSKSDLMSLSDKEMKEIADRLLALHKSSKLSFLKKYRELIELVDNYDDKNDVKTVFNNKEIINDSSITNAKSNIINEDKSSVTNNIDKSNNINNIYNTKNININVNINNTVINNSTGNKINNNSDIINDNENLIKKLKEYRLQMSRAENTKPYIIFSDKQMTNLLEKMPKTKSELKEVSGFGEVKVEKYGDVILKILNE
ncbi:MULTISPECIES: HRDC domain-containing protein [Clostridium]|uniref:HRDC domain-containing protein n=1 Tax=Clostridium TaxID=1485 RepID=UPI0018A95644|nr:MULTISPECIES: HRDC domain-containing protein [Clostridium]MBS5306042.1 NERD domain-containing protein [Clostridium sp.]MDB1969742.1 NERD domain-containing protein [Clostridium tertium]